MADKIAMAVAAGTRTARICDLADWIDAALKTRGSDPDHILKAVEISDRGRSRVSQRGSELLMLDLYATSQSADPAKLLKAWVARARAFLSELRTDG